MNLFRRLKGKEVSRSQRKLLVVGFFLSYAAAGFGTLLPNTAFWLSINFLGIILGPLFMLVLLSWTMPRIDKRKIDERQKTRRNEMYTAAYQILVGIIISLALFLAFAPTVTLNAIAELLTQPNALRNLCLYFVIPFVAFLPTAMLAWLEPNPILDETSEMSTA